MTTNRDALRKLLKERDTLRVRVEVASKHSREVLQSAGDLLATIHRDGGHHTDSVGLVQSVKDAHTVWSVLITQAESDALKAELAEAQRHYADAEQANVALDAQVEAMRGALETAKREAKDFSSSLDMYAKAWWRELRGPYRNKSHEIDALVLTTRERMEELYALRLKVAASPPGVGVTLTREEVAQVRQAFRLVLELAEKWADGTGRSNPDHDIVSDGKDALALLDKGKP